MGLHFSVGIFGSAFHTREWYKYPLQAQYARFKEHSKVYTFLHDKFRKFVDRCLDRFGDIWWTLVDAHIQIHGSFIFRTLTVHVWIAPL